MTKTRLTLLPLSLTFAFGLACMGGKEVEGDDAGECNDGADNDLNGVFDCDEETCVGSPLCEGNTGGGGDEVTLISAAADCDNLGYFYEVQQTGKGSAPELYITFDVNGSGAYSEFHRFPNAPDETDPDGEWELYYMELGYVEYIDDVVSGETSAFPCYLYDETTWVVLVYDENDVMVDCGAWGYSPREANNFLGTDCPTL